MTPLARHEGDSERLAFSLAQVVCDYYYRLEETEDHEYGCEEAVRDRGEINGREEETRHVHRRRRHGQAYQGRLELAPRHCQL